MQDNWSSGTALFLRSVQLSIVSTPNSNSTAFEEEKHCNSITDGIRLTFDSLS